MGSTLVCFVILTDEVTFVLLFSITSTSTLHSYGFTMHLILV